MVCLGFEPGLKVGRRRQNHGAMAAAQNLFMTLAPFLFSIFQHLMLMLKLLISYAIPDIPSWVATEMAKIEYHRREIEKASSFAFLQSSSGLLSSSSAPSMTQSLETDDKSVQVKILMELKEEFSSAFKRPLRGRGDDANRARRIPAPRSAAYR